MSVQSATQLKTYFEAGDFPTAAQFGHLIDTMQGKVYDIRDALPDGFVSDGSVDYTTQVQAACVAIAEAGSGCILIPPNFTLGLTYRSPFYSQPTGHGKNYAMLPLWSNMALVGCGPSSVIKNIDAESGNTRQVVGCDITDATAAIENIVISNLRIHGGRTSQTSYSATNEQSKCIVIRNSVTAYDIKNVLIDRVWLHDTTGDCLSLGSNVNGATVRNVFYWNFLRQGIGIAGSATMAAKRVTVIGCVEQTSDFTPGGSGIEVEPGGTCEDIIITANQVLTGINANDINRLTITGNQVVGRIEGNTVDDVLCANNKLNATAATTYGIGFGYLPDACRVKVLGNIVQAPTSGGTTKGIYLYKQGSTPKTTDSAEVAGNTVVGGAGRAIEISGVGNPYVHDNDTESAALAVYCPDTLAPVVEGNRLDSDTDEAIYVYCTAAQAGFRTVGRIRNNIITSTDSAPLLVSGIQAICEGNIDTLGNPIIPATVDSGAALGRVLPSVFGRTRVHYIRSGTDMPTWGLWAIGDQVWYGTPVAGGVPGKVCTTAGGLHGGNWTGTTAYNKGDWVLDPGGAKVMEATVGGTSGGSEPTWPALGATVVDGTVTWTVRAAAVAVFKDMAVLAS